MSPELQAAVTRYRATLYLTMPAWMRWLDNRLRWWRAWREHPYIVVPRWWPWQPKNPLDGTRLWDNS